MSTGGWLALTWGLLALGVVLGGASRLVAGPAFNRGAPAWTLLIASGCAIVGSLVSVAFACLQLASGEF